MLFCAVLLKFFTERLTVLTIIIQVKYVFKLFSAEGFIALSVKESGNECVSLM